MVFWAQGNRSLYVPAIGEFPQNFPVSVKDIGRCINSSTEDIKIIFHLRNKIQKPLSPFMTQGPSPRLLLVIRHHEFTIPTAR